MSEPKKPEAEKVKDDPRCRAEDGTPLPLSYPRKEKKGSQGRNQQDQMFQNWKEQKREICRDPKCFYPLEPKKNPATGEAVTRETEAGVVIVGECSWDPRHMGGEQTYVKPVRNNEAQVYELP